MEEILGRLLEKMKQLQIESTLLNGKDTLKDKLLEIQVESSCLTTGVENMKKGLQTMKEQNTYCRELLSLIKDLDERILYMEKYVPIQLIEDYKKSVTSSMCEPLSNKENCNLNTTYQSTHNNKDKKDSVTVNDWKKVLFNEPEVCPIISLISTEEFSKVPKYIIGRQPLETLNNLIIIINQILKFKYTILSLGKAAAQKKGEIDLYLLFKRQELDVVEDNGYIYFFTDEDYQRHTKSNLYYIFYNILVIDMLKTESVSTLSDQEDDMDDLDGSIIWSQDEPLSSSEILELSSTFDRGKTDPISLCRLCAGQAIDPVYIYSDLGESIKLAHKINTCLSIKVKKTDPLPKQLCLTCVEKISWCDEFDNQCIKAEETLLEMLKRKLSFDITNSEHEQDVKSCPLCLDGHMNVFDNAIHDPKDLEMYDSDIVLDSSDEEKILNEFKVDTEADRQSIMLYCLGNRQKYLKCGACMNLYHTKEMLDSHKCKPNVQNTSKPYKCHVCNATFTFEERLKFHMQFHKGAKVLYCEICKITFGKELKLFYHYKRYHCKDTAVSCLQCGKLFENQEMLRTHICVDGKTRPHVCEVCSKGFSDGYTLKRHIVTHLPEKPYKCTQCSKSFTQKSRLNKHIVGHGIIIENSQIVWKCVQCGEVFNSCDIADNHYKIHEDKITLIEELSVSKVYHCEFCNSYFTDVDNLKNHRNQHIVEKPYSCNTCNTCFKSYAEAVLHWKEHPRMFKVLVVFLCELCNKDMKELALLYKHKQKRHQYTARKSEMGNNKFICELCGNIFDKNEDIQAHSRDQCSKFPCDICGSLLPTANSLKAHKRRHSGLRPYVCNICGKSYTQSSHMWTHKRFHMGVKPYACEYCDQRFTIKPDLADHTRKKHTRERPFKCDVCNKAFLTGSVFYQHRLIHRGDRRYKCHYCEKAFTRTEALNNHIKIHTGEKPHACDVCGRCFRQKGDMRKHRRTQHTLKQDTH
ncbi:hypothetical protein KM043_009939 [Ampulex compressa]|nr:hypothetical protein KM043_009939 [Ampulex compressa]